MQPPRGELAHGSGRGAMRVRSRTTLVCDGRGMTWSDDPATLLTVTLFLAAVAMLATYLPARRGHAGRPNGSAEGRVGARLR
jgi:hypothetical protein